MNKIIKNIFTGVIIASMVFSVATVFAQDQRLEQLKQDDQGRNQQVKDQARELREQAKERTQQAKEQAKQFKEQAQEKVKQTKEEAKKRLDQLKQDAKTRSQQAKDRIKELREQAQEKVKQIKENARQKINQIKDQRKKERADRIVKQLDHVNQVWTDHFSNVLDKLDDVLQRIKTRSEKAAANGKDVSAVNTAIAEAQSKIAAARSAVIEQAKKTYIIDTSAINQTGSEQSQQNNLTSALREQFKKMHDQLKNDLMLLRDGVIKDARAAVKNAFQVLSQVPDLNKEPATNP